MTEILDMMIEKEIQEMIGTEEEEIEEKTTDTMLLEEEIETVEETQEMTEEEIEMMIELPETGETGMITGTEGITTEIASLVKTTLQTCLKGSGKSLVIDNLSKRLSPSINSGLTNLKESIPESVEIVNAVTSIPLVSKFLRTQNENKIKVEEKKDE